MRAALVGRVRPCALVPTPPAGSRVRRPVRVTLSLGHLSGGGHRATLSGHPEQNLFLLFVGLGTPGHPCKVCPFSCLFGPVHLTLANLRGNSGSRERTWPDLGEFVLPFLFTQPWGSPWRPWHHPCGGSTWEFPCHLLPAGSSADASIPEHQSQILETREED